MFEVQRKAEARAQLVCMCIAYVYLQAQGGGQLRYVLAVTQTLETDTAYWFCTRTTTNNGLSASQRTNKQTNNEINTAQTCVTQKLFKRNKSSQQN